MTVLLCSLRQIAQSLWFFKEIMEGRKKLSVKSLGRFVRAYQG